MGVTYAEVQSQATILGEDPYATFAYCAHYGRLPTDRPAVDGFVSQLQSIRAALGIGDITLIEGYVTERGALPGSLQQVLAWGQNHGFIDSQNLQQGSPQAGAFYLYGTPSTAPPATTPPPGKSSSGFDLSSLTSNPLAIGGVAAVAALLFFGNKRR